MATPMRFKMAMGEGCKLPDGSTQAPIPYYCPSHTFRSCRAIHSYLHKYHVDAAAFHTRDSLQNMMHIRS